MVQPFVDVTVVGDSVLQLALEVTAQYRNELYLAFISIENYSQIYVGILLLESSWKFPMRRSAGVCFVLLTL